MGNSRDHDPARINAVESMFKKFAHYENADVVILPSRDVYFDALPDEYAQYEACDKRLLREACDKGLSEACKGLNENDENYCKTRVALDRVFWTGDYFQRVMVSGQDLKKTLKTSQQKSQAERNLAAQDISGQWLFAFGIVTNEPDQLTRIEMSSERFSLPQSKACIGDLSVVQKEQPYCINGSTISDDASYWVVTNDSLARDTADYSQFGALLPGYQQPSKGVFFTGRLQDALAREPQMDLSKDPVVFSKSQQYRDLFHVDIAKWVAGFSIRHPVGGNAAAAAFQGVAESRASQTTQQELDLAGTAPVAIINEALAKRWWPEGSPLGDRVVFGRFQGQDYKEIKDFPREIVGIAGDTKTVNLKEPSRPTIFLPLAQSKDVFIGMTGKLSWVVSVDSSAGLTDRLRNVIAEIDSTQKIQDLRMVDEIVASTTASSRFDAWLFGIFAGLALTLAAVGVYGLLSYAVAYRRQEIGTRMALGATRGTVLQLFLKQGFMLTCIGLLIGVLGSLALGRFLASQLYGIKPNDPVSFIVVSGLLLLIGLIASYIPSARATKIDPAIALRYE